MANGMSYGLPIGLHTTNMTLFKTPKPHKKHTGNFFFAQGISGHFRPIGPQWDALWTPHRTPYDKHHHLQNNSNTLKTHSKLYFHSRTFGSFSTHRPPMGCPMDFPYDHIRQTSPSSKQPKYTENTWETSFSLKGIRVIFDP